MTKLNRLPTWADKRHVYAVVETPRGSRAKLKFDDKLGAFTLSKPLMAGLTYPYDWGFIPSTRSEDGDPVDILVLHDAATFPGLVLCCEPIGLLEAIQIEKGKPQRNERILLIPANGQSGEGVHSVKDISKQMIADLEKFFEATDALEHKTIKFLGWHGPKSAVKNINKHAL